MGYVVELGGMRFDPPDCSWEQRLARRSQSEIYSLAPAQDDAVKTLIDETGKAGDTLGGVVEICVEGLPFGLGTHAQWDQKLDGRLAQAVMAVQAIKGVEIGLGFEAARRVGSRVHDPIQFDPDRVGDADVRIRADDEPCGWIGGGYDQRPAAHDLRRDEADQHLTQAARID